MEIKMKNNCVLSKELIEEHTSESGIILSVEKYNRKATVICTGSTAVSVGDTIIKVIGQGTKFKINDEEYEVLSENHILGIIA